MHVVRICGRFSLSMDGDEIADFYHGNLTVSWCPRYFIAPSEGAPRLFTGATRESVLQ